VTKPLSGDPPPAPRPGEVLELVHHHPGRLRVRADAFARGSAVVDRVREAVEAQPGVTRFSHNARTGTLLVEYQPGLAEPDDLLERIADSAGLERPGKDAIRALGRTPALIAVEAARELNAITAELTGSRADLRAIVPAALAAFSAYSFVVQKDSRLPRWDNLLYWSYNVFFSLHRREIDAPYVRGAAMVHAVPAGDAEA
jgi:hypothetical protein